MSLDKQIKKEVKYLIILKNKRQIEIMREAGRIVAECHDMLKDIVKPGVSLLELDEAVEKHIVERGAIPSFKGYQGFPASICTAINDVICHGIPDETILKDGDVITIDIGAQLEGYHGDSAWTYAVGEVSDEIKQLMDVTLKALHLGIEQAISGNRVGDIGYAIDSYVTEFGYGNVREFGGHGVGKNLWEEPQILHLGDKGRGARLSKGMVIAIEPMITTGGWKSKVDADGWTARTLDGSICVQYEHTIAITENGPEILTKL